MNGSTKKKKKLKKMLGFYFEYYECVVIFLPLRFICNCGHHIQCMGLGLEALGSLQTNVFEKRGTTLGTFENRKKVCVDVLEALHLFQLLFILRVYIYICLIC